MRRPLRLVHTADVHLGELPTPWHGAEPDADERAFARVIDIVLAEKADVLLIAGDLFDSNRVPEPAIRFAAVADRARRLPGGAHPRQSRLLRRDLDLSPLRLPGDRIARAPALRRGGRDRHLRRARSHGVGEGTDRACADQPADGRRAAAHGRVRTGSSAWRTDTSSRTGASRAPRSSRPTRSRAPASTTSRSATSTSFATCRRASARLLSGRAADLLRARRRQRGDHPARPGGRRLDRGAAPGRHHPRS